MCLDQAASGCCSLILTVRTVLVNRHGFCVRARRLFSNPRRLDCALHETVYRRGTRQASVGETRSLLLVGQTVFARGSSISSSAASSLYCHCVILHLLRQMSLRESSASFICSRGLTSTWRGCCGLCPLHKPAELAHSFLFCCIYFCLYGPFNCISFLKSSRQFSAFSLFSSGLISA